MTRKLKCWLFGHKENLNHEDRMYLLRTGRCDIKYLTENVYCTRCGEKWCSYTC